MPLLRALAAGPVRCFRPSRQRPEAAALVAIAALALAVPAHASPAGAPAVGEATLVVGKARVTSLDGLTRDLQRGGGLRPGDRVETEAGGHAHIRFVDGGLVSVRPASRLVVERYAAAGPGAAIKFRLEEGVVRSITGAWGEAARERFRLNTPVAAIGVKGTDFVVRSSGQVTAASVFTGAIVVSPLTEACAATLGPCATGQEAFLSADMRGQMVELRPDQPMPRLVPAVDLLAAAPARDTAVAAPRQVPVPAVAMEGVAGVAAAKPEGADRVASEALAVETLAAAALADVAPAQPLAPVMPAMPTQPLPPAVTVLPAPTEPPAVPATPAPADPAMALYWTRHAWAVALAGDDFTRRFDAAMDRGTRSLATDGAFTLRRPEATPFAPLDARASFRLTGAAAGVVRDAGHRLETVQVTRGTLEVDFNRAVFATDLTATGPVLGAAVVQATGTIDATGAMRSSAGNAFVAGGLNGNGQEAGLLFRREVPGGVLQGVTLWGR